MRRKLLITGKILAGIVAAFLWLVVLTKASVMIEAIRPGWGVIPVFQNLTSYKIHILWFIGSLFLAYTWTILTLKREFGKILGALRGLLNIASWVSTILIGLGLGYIEVKTFVATGAALSTLEITGKLLTEPNFWKQIFVGFAICANFAVGFMVQAAFQNLLRRLLPMVRVRPDTVFDKEASPAYQLD